MTDRRLPRTPRMTRIDESAEVIADELGHTYVGTEHMLLALVADGDGIAVIGHLREDEQGNLASRDDVGSGFSLIPGLGLRRRNLTPGSG